MKLRLYNTLTRQKEVFSSLIEGKVGIYTCGPTVYAPAHIGNLRSYLFPDVLVKTLRRLGYTVSHVVNITDVGHLTSDADTGEDKLERAARRTQRSAWDIAAEYTRCFLQDLEKLRIGITPSMPRATAHIPEQIALIQTLEQKGYTYPTTDGIYFDTSRFADYGRLARLRAEGLQEGSRVEMGEKRNKTDFALWKFSLLEVHRQMEWESPWGRGFPGWHVECSAMAMKYLGERFDIHTGGSDHIPVHHTNEIAQSEAATGQPFVQYWLHGEHLVLGAAERMGKSEGNLLTLEILEGEGFEPLAFRYLALTAHYRSYLHFSLEALKGAATALMGLRELVRKIGGEAPSPLPPPQGAAAELLKWLCDDLNTPRALAVLWTTLKDASLSAELKQALIAEADALLGLELLDSSRLRAQETAPVPIRELAEARWQARQARNFAESDRLRDAIAAQGFIVRDSKEGYELIRAE